MNLRSALLYLRNLAAIGLQPGQRFSNSLTGGVEAAVMLQEDLSEASLLRNFSLFLNQHFPTLRAVRDSPYSITKVSSFC